MAAGAVVTKDLPDYGLMVGVPARWSGWISRHGHRLVSTNADGIMSCPESKLQYREIEPGVLRCLDLDEETALPPGLAEGNKTYGDFKSSMAD